MARFSLSPPTTSSIQREKQRQQTTTTVPQWKWNFPPQDKFYRPSPVDSVSSDDWSSSSDDEGGSTSSSSEEENESKKEMHNDDEAEEDDEEEEEEPPHPLGFEQLRYGTTRFGLSAQSTSNAFNSNNNNNNHTRDIFNREDEYAWNALIHIDDNDDNYHHSSGVAGEQSFPPLTKNYYLNNSGTSSINTRDLLRGATSLQYNEVKKKQQDESSMEEVLCGMDRIANLVRAASYVSPDDGTTDGSPQRRDHKFDTRETPEQQQYQSTQQFETKSPAARSTSKLLQLAQACEQQQTKLSSEMSILSQQKETSYKQSCQGFLLLLQAEKQRATQANERIHKRQIDIQAIQEQQRLEQAEYEFKLQKELEEQQKQDEERLAAQQAKDEQVKLKQQQHLQSLQQAEEQAEMEAAKKTQYIQRATSLISNLDVFRSTTLSQFDKSKLVSKRRLQFKKIVNGKINTLSHDKSKILEVASMVDNALNQAFNDDHSAQGGGGDAIMSMGHKYLIDLLCSNLIVRVQADGFNGTRGDGFPLAAMFAAVSIGCEELGPVLEGHLYSVCPLCIPALSLNQDTTNDGVGGAVGGGGEDDDENDLMTSLGMLRDKNGEFESFDKFLHRTEVSPQRRKWIYHICLSREFLPLIMKIIQTFLSIVFCHLQ